jgi:hypothetical protein
MPDIVGIAIGVPKASKFYDTKVMEAVDNMTYGTTKSKVKIYFSALEKVALLGAAGLIT